MLTKHSFLLIVLLGFTGQILNAQPELKHSLQGYYISDEPEYEYEDDFDDYSGYYWPSYDDIDDFDPRTEATSCINCPDTKQYIVNNDPSAAYGEIPRYVDHYPTYYYHYPIYHGHRYGPYFGSTWGF